MDRFLEKLSSQEVHQTFLHLAHLSALTGRPG